jgi:hypothetical protein
MKLVCARRLALVRLYLRPVFLLSAVILAFVGTTISEVDNDGE